MRHLVRGPDVAHGEPLGSRAGALAFIAATGLVIVSAGLLLTQLSDESVPVVLALLLLGILAVPPVIAAMQRRLDVFEPVYVVLAFIGIQFPVQAIYIALVRGYDRPVVAHERWLELINGALLLAIAGTIAFLIGYYVPRQAAAGAARALPLPRGDWDRRSLAPILIVLTAIGLAAFYQFMDRVGGLDYFLRNLYLHNELARGRFYLLWVFQLFPIASLVWFAHLASRKGRALGTPLFWVHFAAATLLTLSLGGRGQVLYLWEVLLVIYHYRVRRIPPRVLAVFFVVALLFLFALGSYRRSTAPGGPEFTWSAAVSPAAVADEVLHYDYSSLDIMVLLLDRVPEQVPLRWGRSFLDVVVLPVPRAVYPDKPPPLNTWYNQQLFGAERSGKKASALGEGFVNLHVPGVLLLMLLYGFVARAVYTNLQMSDFGPGAVLVYALLYKFLWSFSGGGFGEVGFELLIRLLPVLLVIQFVRRRHVLSLTRYRAPTLAPHARRS